MLKNKQGSILILTLWIISITVLIVVILHKSVVNEYILSKIRYAEKRCYFLGEGGINLAVEALRLERMNLNSLYATQTNQVLINEVGVLGIYGSGSDPQYTQLYHDIDNTSTAVDTAYYSQFFEIYNDSNDTIDLSDYIIETDADNNGINGCWRIKIRAHNPAVDNWLPVNWKNYQTTLVPPRSFAVILPGLPSNAKTKNAVFATIIPDNAIVARVDSITTDWNNGNSFSSSLRMFQNKMWMYDAGTPSNNFYIRLFKQSTNNVVDQVYIEGNNNWTSGSDRAVSFGRDSLHHGYYGTPVGLTPNPYNCIVWNGGNPYWINAADTIFRYGTPGFDNIGQAASDKYLIESYKSFTNNPPYNSNICIENSDTFGRYFKINNITDAYGNDIGSCTIYILDEKSKLHLNFKSNMIIPSFISDNFDSGIFFNLKKMSNFQANDETIRNTILGYSGNSNFLKYTAKPFTSIDKIDYCSIGSSGNYDSNLILNLQNYCTVYPVKYFFETYSNKILYFLNWNTASDTVLKSALYSILKSDTKANYIVNQWNLIKKTNPFDGLDANGDVLYYYGISGNTPWQGAKKEYFDFITNLSNTVITNDDKYEIKLASIRGNKGFPSISLGPEYMQTHFKYSYYSIVVETSIPIKYFGFQKNFTQKTYALIRLENLAGSSAQPKFSIYKWFENYPFYR